MILWIFAGLSPAWCAKIYPLLLSHYALPASFGLRLSLAFACHHLASKPYLCKINCRQICVTEILSVLLNANKENVPVVVKDIIKTQIYSKDGSVTTIENGYLDIGLIDTMKDLFVNFLGAVVFSIIGFLYIQNREKYKFAAGFIPKNK